MQEGQAGCSGRSGLATGTENRREMKRVKRRETPQQGRGEEEGKSGWGRGSASRGRPSEGWAARQGQAGHLALGRGREGSTKATVSAQRTEGRPGESRSRQGQATGTSKARKRPVYQVLGTSMNAGEPSLVSPRAGREGWKQEPACHSMLHPTLCAG